jgi:hypothetical protein
MSVMAGSAATPTKPPSFRELAQKLLDSPAGRLMTPPARAALQMAARGTRELSHDGSAASPEAQGSASSGGDPPGLPELTNVRVNDPAEDSHQIDQTTQSETSIAVAGSNVVVGFNDSQHGLLFLTSAANLSGYAFSTDGGKTFTDGGAIPNIPGNSNLGDPWLASDNAGNIYYSSLTLNMTPSNRFVALDVEVSKSTDGGRTFGVPVRVDTQAQAGPDAFFYFADKNALTSGRGPTGVSSALYAAWDDFFVDPVTFNFLNGLPMSHSYDGGATWQVTYADQVPLFTFDPATNTCSFQQYIGAQPIVNPGNGTVYDAAEKLVQQGPCNQPPPPLARQEWIFVSHDGGVTWPDRAKIADVIAAPPDGFAFQLGTGQYMRDLEFPTLAFLGSDLYAAWNEGSSGKSHIRLAKSAGGTGTAWTTNFVTSGNNDEIQPAMSGDASGLHILYYRRNPDNTLDVKVSNSVNGSNFKARRVTSQSFPGVLTAFPFDPIIAPFYMGDYIANVSDGTNQYFAWGDNRDIVTNWLWPQGRNDPDVFLATQAGH